MKHRLYIYLLLLFVHGSIFAQVDDVHISQNDSLKKYQFNNRLLGTYLSKQKLKGVTLNDTLYIYIKKDAKIDSLKIKYTHYNKTLDSINNVSFMNGYIFNKLVPDKIEVKNNAIHIYIIHSETNAITVDSISYNHKKLPHNIVKNIGRHYSKKIFNRKLVDNIVTFIEQNASYRVGNKNNILFKDTKAILNIDLQDRMQKNTAEGILGFIYNTKTKSVNLNGQLKMHLQNVLNNNEQIDWRWKKVDSTQNYTIGFVFPFVLGSNFNVSNTFHLQRTGTAEIALYNLFQMGWNYKKHLIAINFTIDNLSSNSKPDLNSKFIGIKHKYLFKQNKELQKYLKENYISNSMALSLNEKTQDFYYRNSFSYVLNTFKHQAIHVKLDNYYAKSNKERHFLTTKNDFFREQTGNFNKIKEAFQASTSYNFITKNMLFYTIHDFTSIKSIENKRFSYLNIGAGVEFLRKNQILTLNISYPIISDFLSNNQHVNIYIKQTIRF